MKTPPIIQGGMGVAVSNWRLARAVSRLGQLGVVSGTGLNTVMARRLQDGDPGGHVRRAFERFPFPAAARRVVDSFYVAGGKSSAMPYALQPMFGMQPSIALQQTGVVAGFVEAWLAKEGHGGVVGINFLEKLQLSNLPALYGAMLAGADFVLMGAGIPREIPGALDALSAGNEATLHVAVKGCAASADFTVKFAPRQVFAAERVVEVARPAFLAIVASVTLAQHLARKATGSIEGLVVEGPTAGGHNAPPRGPLRLSEIGEPIYGPKDAVDIARIREIGLPFWLAGSYASPAKLAEARGQGAAGVQIGTAFAFSDESGLSPAVKEKVVRECASAAPGTSPRRVFTDPRASPTEYPFKVLPMEGSLSEREVFEARPRICNMGYLREHYLRPDGGVGHRCAAEPVADYVAKGGAVEDTVGRKCLCNALLANIGMEQHRDDGYVEPMLLTSGDDLSCLRHFATPEKAHYSAGDVVRYLLAG